MNGPASWPAPVEVTLLGSTGSIGTQALEVIASHPGHFRVRGLAAGGGHPQLLADQAARFGVDVVATAGDATPLVDALRERHPALALHGPQILSGDAAATQLAAAFPSAVVLNGITGGVGLEPTLAALRAGSTLALAMKAAAQDATRAAEATAPLRPKKGRARPLAERSIGSPDPGAVSFALVMSAIAEEVALWAGDAPRLGGGEAQ